MPISSIYIDQQSSAVDLSHPAVDLDSTNSVFEVSMNAMNLAKQLQLFLDHREISATRLAKISGVSKQVLSLWLAGGRPRNIEQLKKVAESLETTVDHLCFGAGIHPQKNFEITSADAMSGVFEIQVRWLRR